MNLRRGLFRLWIVGSALFVLAVALISYPSIKSELDFIAAAENDRAAKARSADEVYQRYYSDLPREEFNKKMETIVKNMDHSRPLSEWTNDELLAVYIGLPDPGPSPRHWATVGEWAVIAFGIPLAVLALGSSLVWALSGFAAPRK